MADETQPDTVAAVDLGSNSFHLIIARVVAGELAVVDRMRDQVQLAAGLDEARCLRPEAQARALATLQAFGQRLAEACPQHVRAVGTATLRHAADGAAFAQAASAALGHRVEVISGREEARLIYLGVARSLDGEPGRRLVVDIGGGSTEVVLGEGYDALVEASLPMGCVSHTLRHFPGGVLSEDAMRRAEGAARAELGELAGRYRALGWERCVGASGTIKAVGEVLRATGWGEAGITPAGLGRLRQAVVGAGHVDALALPGLKAERAGVLAGGLAILRVLFEALGIELLVPAAAALREGVLFDLMGRLGLQAAR